MITNIDIEHLFDNKVDLDTLSNVILSLKATSSRSIKNPLSFSQYSYTADNVFIEFSSPHHHLSLCIPTEKYHRDGSTAMHTHDYYELMYIHKGSLQIQIEDTIYNYSAGDLCLFNQKIHHAEIHQSDSVILYCCLTDIFLEQYPHTTNGKNFYPSQCLPLASFFSENTPTSHSCSGNFLEFRIQPSETGSAPNSTASLLFAMKNELNNQSPGAWLIIYGLFCRLMYTLSDSSNYDCHFITLKTQSLIDSVIRCIKASPGRLSREDLQDRLHYNCDYLNRIFRQNTGMTLSAYCNSIYMKKAASLLLQTDDTIEEIAETIGFSNPSQFYRQFRKHFHMTPHAYRKTCFELLSQEKDFLSRQEKRNVPEDQ